MSLVDPEMVACMLAKPPSTAAPARIADWLERNAKVHDRLAAAAPNQLEAASLREIAWNARSDARTQRRLAQSDSTGGLGPAG
jgi:hypothetical protein